MKYLIEQGYKDIWGGAHLFLDKFKKGNFDIFKKQSVNLMNKKIQVILIVIVYIHWHKRYCNSNQNLF